MTDIDVNQLMVQMRAMAAAAQSSAPAPGVEPAQGGGFGDLLKQSIDAVNASQQQSRDLSNAFVRGEPNVDLTEVMVAVQKASLSFQAITQVRNKLVQAYQDVMNMPV
ncbi:MAG: flagellar hook-basal body complex protein FliE [Gammaproteobacteria bacterium]